MRQLCQILIATSAIFAFAGAAPAGTLPIFTSTASLFVGGGTYNVNSFTGSVDLTLDGPSATQTIFSFATLSPLPTGPVNFTLPVQLDSIWMALPATFDGSQVVANGSLTFNDLGGTVSVQLLPITAPSSSHVITGSFRLSSATPEPGALVLLGSGLALLGAKLFRPRRRA